MNSDPLEILRAAGLPSDGHKLALVTGAAGALGRAAARGLIREGYRVILVDLDQTALEAIAAELGDAAIWTR